LARLREDGSSGERTLEKLPKGRLWLNGAVKIAAPEHQRAAIVSMLFELLCGCSNFRFNWWTRAESARGRYRGLIDLLYFK
jgi:hypothetical protein